MKKIILFSLLLSLPFLTNAQDVPTTQVPMLTKITATWCPNCGTYGWSFFKDAISENGNKVIYVAAHPSGNLVSPEGMDFNSNLSAPGQPFFYLNNSNLGVFGSNLSAKLAELSESVNDMAASAPLAGTGIEVIRDGSTLTAKTKTRFFDDTNGTYHLAVYVIEDHVITTQASVGGSADHRYILRTSFDGATFGGEIANGDIAAGTEFELTFNTDIVNTWNMDNVTFAAVLWKKNDTKFEYVNGNEVVESTPSSVNNQLLPGLNLSWMPNGTAHDLIINHSNTLEEVNIELMSTTGQLIQKTVIDRLTKGRHTIPLATADLPAGTYAVRLSSNNRQQSILLVK